MRVLHASDLHIGLSRYPTPGKPHARLNDVADVLARLCWLASEHHVDLVAIAGDVFDGRHPAPRHVALLARTVASLAEEGVPVVITPGNHDGPAVVGDPTSHTLRWLEELSMPGVWVPLVPDVARLGRSGAKAVVAAMPYPHRRSFDLALPAASPEERHRALSAAADAVVEDLHRRAVAEAFGDEPVIFVGHLTAAGARVGSERTMRLEDDVTVSTSVLDRFDYAALGHIHKQQTVGVKGAYPGSPVHVDFGEASDIKGFLLVDVRRGAVPGVQRLESRARPMLVVDVKRGEPIPPPSAALMAAGPIVRISVDFPDRESARVHRRPTVEAYYAAGAAHVQWDVRVPERALSERALAPGTGPMDALIAYLRSRDLGPAGYLDAARAIMTGVQ